MTTVAIFLSAWAMGYGLGFKLRSVFRTLYSA